MKKKMNLRILLKKQWQKMIIILLLLCCVLLSIQVVQDVRLRNHVRELFVEKLVFSAKSISVNLEVTLQRDEETMCAGLGAAKTYIDMMVQQMYMPEHVFRYNILWKEYDFAYEVFVDGYMSTSYVQMNVAEMLDRMIDTGEITAEDFEYLNQTKLAMDEFCQSLTKEDGALRKEAIRTDYFSECFRRLKKRIYR